MDRRERMAATERLACAIAEYARRRFGKSFERMVAREIGEHDAPGEAVDLRWLRVLFHAEIERRTAAAWFEEARGRRLDAADAAWLAVQRSAVLSLWSIRGVQPGVGYVVFDLLRERVRFVSDHLPPPDADIGDAVLGRLVTVDGRDHLDDIAEWTLAPREGAHAVRQIREKLGVREGILPEGLLRNASTARAMARAFEEAYLFDAVIPAGVDWAHA